MQFPLDPAALRAATLVEIADSVGAARARLAALGDPSTDAVSDRLSAIAVDLRALARSPSPATRIHL